MTSFFCACTFDSLHLLVLLCLLVHEEALHSSLPSTASATNRGIREVDHILDSASAMLLNGVQYVCGYL